MHWFQPTYPRRQQIPLLHHSISKIEEVAETPYPGDRVVCTVPGSLCRTDLISLLSKMPPLLWSQQGLTRALDAAYSLLLLLGKLMSPSRVRLVPSAWQSTCSVLKQHACSLSTGPLINQPLGTSTTAAFPSEVIKEDEYPQPHRLRI